MLLPSRTAKFDEAAYRELIEFQIKGGIHGIVPCGTTGESPTLSHAADQTGSENLHRPGEKARGGDGRSGSNNTAEAVELTDTPRPPGRTRPWIDHSLLQ